LQHLVVILPIIQPYYFVTPRHPLGSVDFSDNEAAVLTDLLQVISEHKHAPSQLTFWGQHFQCLIHPCGHVFALTVELPNLLSKPFQILYIHGSARVTPYAMVTPGNLRSKLQIARHYCTTFSFSSQNMRVL
jgi:hypothetical protein